MAKTALITGATDGVGRKLFGDGDTRATFDAIHDFAEATNLFEVQLTVLTPFPGTPLYDRLRREGLLARDRYWDLCTLFDVNYVPEKMSVAELETGFRDLLRRIYDTGLIEERRRRFFERQSALRRTRVGEELAAQSPA